MAKKYLDYEGLKHLVDCILNLIDGTGNGDGRIVSTTITEQNNDNYRLDLTAETISGLHGGDIIRIADSDNRMFAVILGESDSKKTVYGIGFFWGLCATFNLMEDGVMHIQKLAFESTFDDTLGTLAAVMEQVDGLEGSLDLKTSALLSGRSIVRIEAMTVGILPAAYGLQEGDSLCVVDSSTLIPRIYTMKNGAVDSNTHNVNNGGRIYPSPDKLYYNVAQRSFMICDDSGATPVMKSTGFSKMDVYVDKIVFDGDLKSDTEYSDASGYTGGGDFTGHLLQHFGMIRTGDVVKFAGMEMIANVTSSGIVCMDYGSSCLHTFTKTGKWTYRMIKLETLA